MRYLLGLLFQKGCLLVLITNTTRIWEHSDSMNHAVWKRCSGYLGSDRNAMGIMGMKTKSIVKKVRKSKIELTGPSETMKRLMNAMSQRLGLSTYSSSTVSVVIVDWDMS